MEEGWRRHAFLLRVAIHLKVAGRWSSESKQNYNDEHMNWAIWASHQEVMCRNICIILVIPIAVWIESKKICVWCVYVMWLHHSMNLVALLYWWGFTAASIFNARFDRLVFQWSNDHVFPFSSYAHLAWKISIQKERKFPELRTMHNYTVISI